MSGEQTALGLDVGARRIGTARGDSAVKLASPLAAIGNDAQVWENLVKIIRKSGAEIVVVGLPRDAGGAETAQSQFSRSFAQTLREHLAENNLTAEIIFQDESLTSVAAEKILRARKNFDEKMLRDGTLDSEAAAIILQDFLEGWAR